MSPLINSILILSLITGTLITMNSNHWLLAWLGLEINMMAIVPLISKTHHPRATEATIKYFLAQTGASLLMLFASSTNAWHTGTWDITQLMNPMSCTALTIALCMKIGLAPMHLWLPEVMQGTTLKVALIIATWQKLAPMSLILMTSNSHSKLLLMLMATLSIVIGGWGGLNQTQLRKIMAYSSIANMGWMIIILQQAPKLSTLTLLLYIMMTTTMFMAMTPQKTKTIKMIGTTWTLSPPLTIIMMLTLTSLGGLPPMTGFMPKWLILEKLMSENMTPLATITAMATLLSLFFYLRLFYMTTMTVSPNTMNTTQKWRLQTKTMMIVMLTSPATLMLLPILPLINP
uniref:NADH-ubiquinone oxidoreductase chain 2 n=1 Tax=Aspidoscelis sexlineatus viridis TaxID=171145 RepID=G0T3C3_9SAUR|nr:NADH dehydrogenase subunit 2 [Aspidoscelis sexlineatus]ADL59417.1 NADH dehydrogenase subunit 2 [Aspidoscelis sexlineatus viridis]UXX18675.1 NADH dehydrogenase subunit 2 [Aspidoscelis sexlineatus]UXX18688.1 NADH dehydrogenase subunit 2 [Aspidoscelis sexlineatus]UXX18701.1 NADH dehydrogenase subunit 2 [Aspidoscelis sexlineatus]UXX18714.1 NADH dehydrogenase subunit 2 [Aspidoscelis sexlineatus]